jgi:hypothetical protein
MLLLKECTFKEVFISLSIQIWSTPPCGWEHVFAFCIPYIQCLPQCLAPGGCSSNVYLLSEQINSFFSCMYQRPMDTSLHSQILTGH